MATADEAATYLPPGSGVSERFCDGIGNVLLVRGMVRVELLGLDERRGRLEAPLKIAERLVMSPEGFLRTFAALDRLVKETGLAVVVPLRGPPSTSDPMHPAVPRSPNFADPDGR
jgi:hypothetical protein